MSQNEQKQIKLVLSEYAIKDDGQLPQLLSEHQYVGQFVESNSVIFIRYPENQLGETTTVVKIDSHELTILRTGEVKSKQVFKQLSGHYHDYQTPHGFMQIYIYTHKLDVTRDVDGIRIHLKYDITFEGQPKETKIIAMHLAEEVQ